MTAPVCTLSNFCIHPSNLRLVCQQQRSLGRPFAASISNQCDFLDVGLLVSRFSGKVGEFDGTDKHLVLYDDGDEEWVNLATDKIRLAPETGNSSTSSSSCNTSEPLHTYCHRVFASDVQVPRCLSMVMLHCALLEHDTFGHSTWQHRMCHDSQKRLSQQ